MASTSKQNPHFSALAGLCRVCGKLLTTQKLTYDCKDHSNDLCHTFGINISNDKAEIHPPKVCYDCYRSMKRHLKLDQKGREYNHATQVMQWQEHSDECQTCELFTKSRRGGRPKKSRKNRGRPTSDETTRAALRNHIRAVAAPKCIVEVPLSPSRFVSVVGLKTLVCVLCSNVIDEGVETHCNHLVCAPCFCTYLSSIEAGVPSCPACSTQLSGISDVHPVPPVVQDIVMELQVHCDNFSVGCPAVISLRHLSEHVAQCHPPYTWPQSQSSTKEVLPVSSSSSLPTTPPRPPTSQTQTLTPSKISAILDRPMETPLSEPEKKAVTHLVKCAIGTNPSAGGGTTQVLELPTGGQVGTLIIQMHL